MVRRLIDLGVEQPEGWWRFANVQAVYRRLARDAARRPGPCPGGFAGKGIVIVGGGRYLPCTYVTVRLLRHVGCALPVEVWHLDGEMDEDARSLLAGLGATCVNADALVRDRPFRFVEGHWWKGWQLKPYAIVHSRFEEVLYLDADCYPVRDPAFLFRVREYRNKGAVFWPDLASSWNLLGAGVWKVFGVPARVPPRTPPLESGQILVSKKACWRELQLALWYNAHAPYVYRHVWGDKDTFTLAWQMLDRPFAMLHPRAGWDVHTILQYDQRGRVLFQHRCRDKFRLNGTRFPSNPQLPGANVFNPNLAHEKECFHFLQEFAQAHGQRPVGAALPRERPRLETNK